jgi:hypothetical protein
MLKTGLAVTCLFTLAATAFLSVSLMVLQPPPANYQQWSIMAALIMIQGALTLVTLFVTRAPAGRYAVLTGAVAIAIIGALWVYNTVSGPHFEGYALVLGSALVVQSALTLVAFARSADDGWRLTTDDL